jgi:hypothetical protein
MADRNPQLRDAALLVRRATMRVDLNMVNELAALAWPDAVRAVLDAPPNPAVVEPSDKSDNTVKWWNQQITSSGSGIHERMTFFWHTQLTSHRYASGQQELIAPQLNMLRGRGLRPGAGQQRAGHLPRRDQELGAVVGRRPAL